MEAHEPDRPIVVVDWRTYRGAQKRVSALVEAGDLVRAKFGIVAMTIWLRYEIQTGPKRHRIRYAADLGQLEILRDDLNEQPGSR
jgi:hypothetical protein